MNNGLFKVHFHEKFCITVIMFANWNSKILELGICDIYKPVVLRTVDLASFLPIITAPIHLSMRFVFYNNLWGTNYVLDMLPKNY